MTDGIHLQGSFAFLPEMERRIDSLYAALARLLITEQFETALHTSEVNGCFLLNAVRAKIKSSYPQYLVDFCRGILYD